jgi:hypothetical protein
MHQKHRWNSAPEKVEVVKGDMVPVQRVILHFFQSGVWNMSRPCGNLAGRAKIYIASGFA